MPPQTSTLSTVIDLLCAKFQGLNLVVNGAPVSVYDGPEGPSNEDNFVVVMADEDEPEAQVSTEWAALGSLARYENYDVIVCTFTYVGGDDSTATIGPNDAQYGARTNATTIDDALVAAVLADVNLAVQAAGPAPIIWCMPGGYELGQMPPDEESGMGRYVYIRRKFSVYNRLAGG